MSNRKKLDTFKTDPHAEQTKDKDRRTRRALRHNKPVASIVLDHHRPHSRKDNCGPSCKDQWAP